MALPSRPGSRLPPPPRGVGESLGRSRTGARSMFAYTRQPFRTLPPSSRYTGTSSDCPAHVPKRLLDGAVRGASSNTSRCCMYFVRRVAPRRCGPPRAGPRSRCRWPTAPGPFPGRRRGRRGSAPARNAGPGPDGDVDQREQRLVLQPRRLIRLAQRVAKAGRARRAVLGVDRGASYRVVGVQRGRPGRRGPPQPGRRPRPRSAALSLSRRRAGPRWSR